jgi:predicted phosphodiesterase
MRALIIPDIHTKHVQAQKIIDNETFDKIILGGDLFDDFGDNAIMNIETARWYKNLTEKHKVQIVLSNHDAAYRWPTNRFMGCAGFEYIKAFGINDILKKEDWDKFQLYIEEQGFIITHAGVSLKLYDQITNVRKLEAKEKYNNVINVLKTESQIAIDLAEHDKDHVFFSVSYIRGGMSSIPGLNWCDYREFIPIKNVNQIFFHTPLKEVLCKTMNPNGHISNWKTTDTYLEKSDIKFVSYNYDLDTHLKFYGILENKKLQIFQAFKDGQFDQQLVYTKQH